MVGMKPDYPHSQHKMFGGKWSIHNKDSINTSFPNFMNIINERITKMGYKNFVIGELIKKENTDSVIYL